MGCQVLYLMNPARCTSVNALSFSCSNCLLARVAHTNNFLYHIRNLREYTDEMFVQFLLQGEHKGYCHLIDMYSEETESWRIPYEEFSEKIEAILKETE